MSEIEMDRLEPPDACSSPDDADPRRREHPHPTVALEHHERALGRRAQIILLAAAGLDNKAIAAELNVGRIQVGRWRERYAAGRLAVIQHDLPRSGRKPVVDAAGIVRLTIQTTPKAATHWSTRTLAKARPRCSLP